MNKFGTLLTEKAVTPIIPLGRLVEKLRFRVEWGPQGFELHHPRRGILPTVLIKRCPMVPRRLALELIEQLELQEERARIRVKAVSMVESSLGGSQVTLSGMLQKAAGNEEAREVAIAAVIKRLFPEAPAEILEQLIPVQSRESEPLVNFENAGLNRRARRRLDRAKRVLVKFHVGLSGWKAEGDEAFLEVTQSKNRDLLGESLYGYLFELALAGKVSGIIGCLPSCVTEVGEGQGFHKVLRAASGPGRFGVQGLVGKDRQRVFSENVSLLRMLFLIHVAREANAAEGRSLFEVLECPSRRNQRGFSNGLGGTVVNWPEVRDLGLYWASVDHGYWGADATGSVSIGSSSWDVFERLHETVLSSDLRGLGAELGLTRDNQGVPGERLSRWPSSLARVVSAVWRAWSLSQESDAKEAIARLKVLAELLRVQGKDIGQLEELCRVAAERVGSDEGDDDGRGIGPMGFLTKAQQHFREHVNRGHLPWRKDCRACLQSAAYHHVCKRRKHAHAFALSLDLAGPFKAGADHTGLARYALVAVYTFPKFWRRGEPAKDPEVVPSDPVPSVAPDGEAGASADEPVLESGPLDEPIPDSWSDIEETPDEHAPADQAALDEVDRLARKWKLLTEASLEPLPMWRIPFVEVLYNKTRKTVVEAVSKIYVELKHHGFPVQRVHSDRGAEFVNTSFRNWCLARDLAHTTSPGDLPQSNGLSERFVGLIKQKARCVLHDSGLSKDHWPSAVRYAAFCMSNPIFKELGLTMRTPLPFGAKIWIRERGWRVSSWSSRATSAILLCPSRDVSRGWIVFVVRPDGSHSFLISTRCYTAVREPEPVELARDDPVPAESLPLVPHAKSSGAPPALAPASDSHPPVCPSGSGTADAREPRFRLRFKSSAGPRLRLVLAKSQGGGSRFFEVLDCGPDEDSDDEEDRDFKAGFSEEVTGPGECCDQVGEMWEDDGVFWDEGQHVGTVSKVWYVEPVKVGSDKVWDATPRDGTEELATNLLDQGAVTRGQLRELLETCRWPSKKKRQLEQSNPGRMIFFGAFSHGGIHGVCQVTYQRKHLVRLLNRYIKDQVPHAEYSALCLSESSLLDWHRDKNNLQGSLNFVVPVGVFSGGDIRVLEEGASLDEAEIDPLRGFNFKVSEGPVAFNARRRHKVLPHQGDRLVLVAYTPRGLGRLSEDQIRDLRGLGFPLPAIPVLKHLSEMPWLPQDVPEGNGVCGREGSAEVVENPGVAYLLPPEDAHAIVAETFFLSRVATRERYALLEEIRLSDPNSLPSVDSLANLEMRISRLQAELELSRAAESFQEISTAHSDSVRMAKCRLAAAVASGPVPADVQNEGVQEDTMFQTRTVDPQEANSQIQRWVAPLTEELVLRVGSLGAGSVGFEGQNQFPQSCSSIFRHRVSSCCSISLFMYFNSNFSTGGTAHGSLESICLDPGVGQKRQAH